MSFIKFRQYHKSCILKFKICSYISINYTEDFLFVLSSDSEVSFIPF